MPAPRCLRNGLLLLALLLIAALGLNRGIHRVAAANEDPEVKTSFEVAQFLARKQTPALILARPLPEDQLRFHLDRAEKSGGARGREMAIRMLRETETTPFDYQRVLAFSWMGREKILSAIGSKISRHHSAKNLYGIGKSSTL